MNKCFCESQPLVCHLLLTDVCRIRLSGNSREINHMRRDASEYAGHLTSTRNEIKLS